MAKVTITDLSKYFGEVCAIAHLSLEIEDGEFLTIVGPSGCGKTTTLNCVAGLEEPTAGTIAFDDQIVNDLAPKDRDVAMVFQDYALYPHMNAYDNMAFSLRIRKLKRQDIDSKIGWVSEMLGIQELLHRRPAQLSGGQRQRVALARAIVRDPVVFLMDEPLSNLDAALRVRTRTELKALQQQLGTTTIYVTHDQEEAMVLSDRIAILKEGVLQQCGAPADVYERPVNLYVAAFIGSPAMSLIRGKLEIWEKQMVFMFADGVVRLPAAGAVAELVARRPNRTMEVIAGIRPEGIGLEEEVSKGDLAATIVTVEPIGPITYLGLQVGSTPLKVGISPEEIISVGQEVGISLAREKVHFFDGQAHTRLC